MNSGGPRAAFTLFEILMVVLTIGVLGTLVVGGFRNVVPAGRQIAAINKARVINAARITYALTVPAAATAWTAAASDTARVALLVEAGALNGAPGEWLTASGGYTLSLAGPVRSRTELRSRDGTELNYTD